ncbi:MAG: anaerobic ribonucleoside-triphosphate reductase activating protein [Candidatus Bruticola sp.]
MNYAAIHPLDVANGTGIRVSLFVSGCPHHCPNCFNKETWSEHYGYSYTSKTEDKIMTMLCHPHVRGLTVLGGEPLTPQHQSDLLPLLQRVKRELPKKDIWIYTGYLLEDFLPNGSAYTKNSLTILGIIDMLVDGPFIEAKKDLRLKFRGSANQRLISKEQLQQFLLNTCQRK